jgi:hypothetical protein
MTDETLTLLRSECPGWDLYNLHAKFESWVNAEPSRTPANWQRAFVGYRQAMIERNEACLDKLIRQSRRRLKGRQQDYCDHFGANHFHFARNRIAMLALAHSHAGQGV